MGGGGSPAALCVCHCVTHAFLYTLFTVFIQRCYSIKPFYYSTKAALRHFNDAAAGGSGPAKTNLGIMHSYGIGVDQNNETAARNFLEGAALGEPSAFNGLGYMFMTNGKK